MEPIVWNDEEFSVGHAQIDAQHKVLVKQLNELIILQKQRFNIKKQNDILNRLANYVENHLQYEEALLRRVGYKGFDEHELLHSQYMMEIDMWLIMLEDEDPVLPNRMCQFVSDWLQNHIIGEDMKFRPYIKGAA